MLYHGLLNPVLGYIWTLLLADEDVWIGNTFIQFYPASKIAKNLWFINGSATIEQLRSLCSRFELPDIVATDNGSSLASTEV